ncbi:MAG: DegV family protein, partial [Clostridia bacterium]|nr:DegV family protein [Clostridia bacterium]
MNKFDIFVDSGANLPDELLKRHGITVVPFSCIINGEERLCYEKDRPFKETAEEFYSLMRGGAEIKTSLVPKERFIEYAAPSLEAGRDVIILTISAGISGTYNQALNAKEELEEKYPDNKVY